MEKAQGDFITAFLNIIISRWQQRMEMLSSPGGTWRKYRAMGISRLGEVSSQCKKDTFYRENYHSQIQSCQRSGRVPLTANSQDLTLDSMLDDLMEAPLSRKG